jgi:hypothetical protein
MEPDALGRDLIESDAQYFEGGALVEDLGGAMLAHLPGLESIAAGCVVHRIDPARLPENLDGWLECVEGRVAAVGCRRPRLYLADPFPALEAVLARRGYEPRIEIGFATVFRGDASGEVALAPVEGERGWEAKLKLHRESGSPPDGHETDADAWVELERRKAAAGAFQPYLLVSSDSRNPLARPLGAVAFAPCGDLLRLKNLVVHPARRRQAVGTAAVALGARMAKSLGKQVLACFAVAGGTGELLYRRRGLVEIVHQTEWMRVA